MQRDYRLTVTRNDMLSRVTIREGHFKDHPSLLMRDTLPCELSLSRSLSWKFEPNQRG